MRALRYGLEKRLAGTTFDQAVEKEEPPMAAAQRASPRSRARAQQCHGHSVR